MSSFLFMFIISLANGYLNNGLLSISITRHHKGDIFIVQGKPCYQEFCTGLSGGTATPTGKRECECKCAPNQPVFRDDLNTCVNDFRECNLVPFASSSTIKKIPYVFLPLKGQIVYPSAEIKISETESPVCVVSGGQFLGQSGWVNLRNNTGMEPPFRLFRDEGHTYLQWLGETSLRMAMEGRIILVHLMCKEASTSEEPKIFTPCVAFRVAGNPNMREILFATDVHLKDEYGGNLRARDYIAIGTCSLLLAVIYIAIIFLYLNIRRRKQKKGNKKMGEDAQLTLVEEGVVKNNPLLQASMHLSQSGQDNAGYVSDSNSCCSDADQTSDFLGLDDENLIGPQNMQTSAIIHPCELDYGETTLSQDSSNIEKLPEENVSIVETLEAKDESSVAVKGMTGANGRRKLYFNPSYFEPDLLKAPPPAAVEFLTKIREVITIAKHKMSAKKFSPSLLGIPEEDASCRTGYGSALSLRKSPLSEKSETKRGTKPETEKPHANFHIVPNDFYCPSDTKQKIIRKWLEDVPVMILQDEERKSPCQKVIFDENKILNKSKLWQLNETNSTKAPTPTGRREKKRPSTKGRAPPLPTAVKSDSNFETQESEERESGKHKESTLKSIPPHPPPLPTFHSENQTPRTEGKDFVPQSTAKNLMDAVIQELTTYKNQKITKESQCDVDNDEIDVETQEKENNANLPSSKEGQQQDDHEYEIILLNADPPQNEERDLKIYNLPEILYKNDRTEGYSLVSEVYVNDGYSYCSGECSPSSYSTVSAESETPHYDSPVDNSGRLTIHVNDSPERYKTTLSESESFEPDTLDRKPRSDKLVKIINGIDNKPNGGEYCNQKFHNECTVSSNEQFTDSLERPRIMLKTNGTFKRNLDQDIDYLLRNFNWNKAETVGSLREIYEAKSKSNTIKSRSLIDTTPHHERVSTLSYSEDRKNKLLHHGIVLHVEESDKKRRRSLSKILPRPPKPTSRSVSPALRSHCTSPSFQTSPRSVSPPLPPPRSVPASPPPRSVCSPPPPPIHPRPTNCSPIQCDSNLFTAPARSPSDSLHRVHKPNTTPPKSPIPPPRPPKPTVQNIPHLPPKKKPPLPPKNLKKHTKPTLKFAGRPLPPLPRSLSTSPYKDLETLSTTSIDSLNSSEYEAFYTLPYEENDEIGSIRQTHLNSMKIRSLDSPKERRNGNQRRDKNLCGNNRPVPHGPGDSGYLSTDSNDSYCHNQMLFSTHFSRISENGSQNSETEESVFDGASESGGESIATDSFFYGNFKKNEKNEGKNGSEGYSYSLRLSDVEVNSDTERHCVPIMVRP